MIELLIGGRKLMLYNNAAIRLNYYSPFFEENKGKSTFSNNFDIPICPQNRLVFGFVEGLNNTNYTLQYVCTLRISKMFFAEGILTIDKISRTAYRASLSIDLGKFLTLWGDNFLKTAAQGSPLVLLKDGGIKINDTTDFVATRITNEKFFDQTEYVTYPYVNYNINTAPLANPTPFSPFLSNYTLLQRIMAYTGYTIEGSFISDAELQKLHIYNTTHVDVDQNQLVGSSNPLYTLFYDDFVPDIEIKSYLAKTASMFCIAVFVDDEEKKIKLVYKKDIIQNGDVVDWNTRKYYVNEISHINNKITLQYEESLNFTRPPQYSYMQRFAPVVYGDGESAKTMSIQAGTLRYYTNNVKVSYDEQEGSYRYGYDQLTATRGGLKGSENDYPLRFLLRRGSSAATSYATAAPESAYNYSLEVDGAKGLYEKFWKEFVQLSAKTKYIQMDVWLNILDIIQLDMSKKVRIGGNIYLIKSLQVNFKNATNTIQTPAKLELVKI